MGIQLDVTKTRPIFNKIAPVYDFMNTLLSLGVERIWRRRYVRLILETSCQNDLLLDLCTGTAEIPKMIGESCPHSSLRVVGGDCTDGMLRIGQKKVSIPLVCLDAETLPFASETFSAVTVAFGIRNVENRPRALAEMFRVCQQGGVIYIMEFTQGNASKLFSYLFSFYFKCILPLVGGLVSGSYQAYKHLPTSVGNFPNSEGFIREISEAMMCEADEIETVQLPLRIASIFKIKRRDPRTAL